MIRLKAFDWVIDDVDTVIFDKDGTIQDLHTYWGEIIKMRSEALVNRFKLDSSFFEKICLWMGYDLNNKKLLKEGPVGIISREEIIDKLVIDFKKDGVKVSEVVLADIFDEIHKKFLNKMDNYVKILPGIKDLLINLKKNKVKVAIVTSDSIENTKKCIGLLGLDDYIDQYVGRDHSPFPKTSGEPAKIALSLLDSKNSNTVCFGDASMDLIMAKNSGLKAGIGITYGQTPTKDLLKFSKYVLNSYEELEIQ